MKPSVCRIVLYTHSIEMNGTKLHPAIITRVWSDECVNLMVFPDSGDVPFSQTSVSFSGLQTPRTWNWPPRI